MADSAGNKVELGMVMAQLEAARREKEMVDTELWAYRNRAQALLKSKDADIAKVREAAAAAAESEELAALRQQLATALAAAEQAAREGAEALERVEVEAAEEAERLKIQVEQLQSSSEYYQGLLQRAQAAADDYGRRVEALEARLAHHSAEGEEGRRAAEALAEAEARAEALTTELEAARAELRSRSASNETLMEAKGAEVLQLVRRNALLQEELVAVRHSLSAAEAALAEAQAAAASARAEADAAAAQMEARARRDAALDDEDRLHEAALAAFNLPAAPAAAANTSATPLRSRRSSDGVALALDVRAPGDILNNIIRPEALNLTAAAAVAAADRDAAAAASHGPSDGGDESMLVPVASASATDFDVAPSPAATMAAAGSLAGSLVGEFRAVSHSGAGDAGALAVAAREVAALRGQVVGLEREVAELEKEVALREEMERALKESVRDMERAMQRQAKGANVIDAEYLKDTVIKMFLTGEAEKLLPVFATILSFSPEEVKRCKEGLQAIRRGEVPLPGAAAAVDSTIHAISSLSWLGGGGGKATPPSAGGAPPGQSSPRPR
ncbi:hypothetical protein GPECTOR_531g533 [Gonium pectorale]|uniref:GRIP domain-containing protein n=1 Tax=Gonium pectorale TaxID=33097 RepID=A0A150FUP6_GONPE|nr:hypothetical protein GPECTOR_531g533 [Gonium pectorale]|eukprot:KXZ41344.1 hypothetical protein GPECTOR_531g533 [Gonium pectorale]